LQTKKVLVLKGGFSAERDVSLVSGSGVAKALKNCGFKVIEHDLTSVEDFFECLKKEKPDVVFNALHGNWGEDGAIQGFLDLLQIPYTHSNMESSLLGMNKHITKNEISKIYPSVRLSACPFSKNYLGELIVVRCS